ncbi:MAG: ABC transporter permease [Ignavibacteriaceae bacterium]
MLKNYLKIFIRNLTRNKTYSVINILGLSIGIASSILIMLWIANELSYDRFHKNADVIYRVVADDGTIGKMSVTCGPLSEYTKTNYADVVSATRYMPYEGSIFKYKDKILKIEKGAFADSDFFEMFSFSFLRGNPENTLSNLTDIVITESTAKKFFGNKDPVGKTLLVDGKDP